MHKAPLPSDSTNCAMIVSTSGNGDPALINLRMLSTDSMEESADPFCWGSTFDRTGAGDCLADFIFNTAAFERSLGNHNGDQLPEAGSDPASVENSTISARASSRSQHPDAARQRRGKTSP